MADPDPRSLVARLRGRRILVVGDLILDEYWIGRATRLSREAPVPVLELERRTRVPGGAANPAANVVALEGEAGVVGVVGSDEQGEALLALLAQAGIGASGIIREAARPTTTKTRLLAESFLRFPQHLARLDHLDRTPIGGAVEDAICAAIAEGMRTADAVLVSDYKGGVVTERVIRTVLDAAREHGKIATVDSQGDLLKFRGFALVKCNRSEAEAQLGKPLLRDADFEHAGAQLLPDLAAGALVITRGPDGMTVIGQGQPAAHLPATNRSEVFDATGAGDTVIAVLTQALVAGLDLRTAAHLANTAAGLVVRRLGNATVTPAELVAALEGEG
jgi:rfaE bifunctional protein kinase chain/domain